MSGARFSKFTPATLPEWKLCVPVAPLYFITVSEELGTEHIGTSVPCNIISFVFYVVMNAVMWPWRMIFHVSLTISNEVMKPAGNQLYDNHLWLPTSVCGRWGSPMISLTIPVIFNRFFFDRSEWITECKVIIKKFNYQVTFDSHSLSLPRLLSLRYMGLQWCPGGVLYASEWEPIFSSFWNWTTLLQQHFTLSSTYSTTAQIHLSMWNSPYHYSGWIPKP